MIAQLDRLPGLFEALAVALPEQRWFGDKGREVIAASPEVVAWLQPLPRPLALLVLRVRFSSGPPSSYHLALAFDPDEDEEASAAALWSGEEYPGGRRWRVREALSEPESLRAIFGATQASGHEPGGEPGLLLGAVEGWTPDLSERDSIRTLGVEQSNTNMVVEDRHLVKIFRRAWSGTNPEVEMAGALTRAAFPAIAPVRGWIEVRAPELRTSLALIQRYLANGTDGFSLALTSLRDLEGDLLADADGEVPPPEVCTKAVLEQGASFLPSARELGQLTAAMHLALASEASGLSPASQAMGAEGLGAFAAEAGAHLERLLRIDELRLEPLRVRADAVRAAFAEVGTLGDGGRRLRVHGDLHLGQLLRTDEGWHFLDFEGRPGRAPEERRRLSSPLLDVAGMMRSFDYAAAVALRQQVHPDEANARTLEPYGRAWAEVMREAFWVAYRSRPGIETLLPGDPGVTDRLLAAFAISQAMYELDYELNARPDWIEIPLEGIARLTSVAPR